MLNKKCSSRKGLRGGMYFIHFSAWYNDMTQAIWKNVDNGSSLS